MRLTEFKQNPIVEILREESLSVIKAKERIDREWDLPPEGFPMERIAGTLTEYLNTLERDINYVIRHRRLAGIRTSKIYLRERFGVTEPEYRELKGRNNALI
jgi:hypothetical protein